MHIKHMHCMIEKLSECAKCEFEKGIEHVDTKEMGEVIEMLKELCEAEYYARISKAMEEAEEDEEQERKYYRGQRRNARGQYMSGRMGRRRGYTPVMPNMYPLMHEYDEEWERDMDMQDGRMYFPETRMSQGSGTYSGGTRQSSQSGQSGQGGRMQSGGTMPRYGYTHKEYLEAKQKWNANDPDQHKMRKQALDEHLNDLIEMGKETVSDMTPEEKQLWKQKISKLISM